MYKFVQLGDNLWADTDRNNRTTNGMIRANTESRSEPARYSKAELLSTMASVHDEVPGALLTICSPGMPTKA